MKRVYAFDVDGTLIDYNDVPREEIVEMARSLAFDPANTVIVWSGGGAEYAAMWARRLGIDHLVTMMAKDNSIKPSVAIDDVPETYLGATVTLVVQTNIPKL